MFRVEYERRLINLSFPRIRGDVPFGVFNSVYLAMFSPHTRGCSERMPLGGENADVFPAYAGMFLG